MSHAQHESYDSKPQIKHEQIQHPNLQTTTNQQESQATKMVHAEKQQPPQQSRNEQCQTYMQYKPPLKY